MERNNRSTFFQAFLDPGKVPGRDRLDELIEGIRVDFEPQVPEALGQDQAMGAKYRRVTGGAIDFRERRVGDRVPGGRTMLHGLHRPTGVLAIASDADEDDAEFEIPLRVRRRRGPPRPVGAAHDGAPCAAAAMSAAIFRQLAR
jgi:hypothetical protein